MFSVVLLNYKNEILEEILVTHHIKKFSHKNINGENVYDDVIESDKSEDNSVNLARSWAKLLRGGFGFYEEDREAHDLKYIVSAIIYTDKHHKIYRTIASFPCWYNILTD